MESSNGARDSSRKLVRLQMEPEALVLFRQSLEAAGLLTEVAEPDAQSAPDVAVVGVRAEDGTVMLEASVRRLPETPHVAWSASGAAHLIGAAFRAGASAYVWGEANEVAAELTRAVKSLLQAAPDRERPVYGTSPFDEFLPRAQALSPREREVLGYIASGLDNLQIAAHLGVCERTVKSHVTALYRKLAQENRAQLALFGARLGLAWKTQPTSTRAQQTAL